MDVSAFDAGAWAIGSGGCGPTVALAGLSSAAYSTRIAARGGTILLFAWTVDSGGYQHCWTARLVGSASALWDDQRLACSYGCIFVHRPTPRFAVFAKFVSNRRGARFWPAVCLDRAFDTLSSGCARIAPGDRLATRFNEHFAALRRVDDSEQYCWPAHGDAGSFFSWRADFCERGGLLRHTVRGGDEILANPGSAGWCDVPGFLD